MSEFSKSVPGGITTCLNIILSPDPAKCWSPGNNIHKHSQFLIDDNNSSEITSLFPTGPLLNIKEVEEIIPSQSFLDLKSVEISEDEEVEEELSEKNSLKLYFDGPSDLELTKLEIINNSWNLTPIFEDMDQDFYREGSSPIITTKNSIRNELFDKSRPQVYLSKGLNSKPTTESMVKTLIPYEQYSNKRTPTEVIGIADTFNDLSIGSGLNLGNTSRWSLQLASILMRNELARTANPSYYHERGYLDPQITKTSDIANRWFSLAEIPDNKRFIEDITGLTEAYETALIMFSELLMMQRVIDDITLFSQLGILGNGGFLSTLIIPESPEDDIMFAKALDVDAKQLSLHDEHLVTTAENYLMSKYVNMDFEYNPPFFFPLSSLTGPGIYYKNYIYALLLFERLYFRFVLQVLEWNENLVAADPANIYDISEEMFKQHNPKRLVGLHGAKVTEAELKKIYTAQKELFKIIHTPVMPRIGNVDRMKELKPFGGELVREFINRKTNLKDSENQLAILSELEDLIELNEEDRMLKEWIDDNYMTTGWDGTKYGYNTPSSKSMYK